MSKSAQPCTNGGVMEKEGPAAGHSGRRGASRRAPRYTLITGGAGFIGSNLADRLASGGREVLIYDNLSRSGVEGNLQWLSARHGDRVRCERADVRDADQLRKAVKGADQVFHFAAQVAVTESLSDPAKDFEVNLRGTLNLLEAIRKTGERPPLAFTSTNKVYGALPEVTLRRRGDRYEPSEKDLRAHGVGEERALDFHSPYGCSKGAADQYVLDYARSFGLPTAVFRMSCIYGPRQMGTEDQGWVAHFLMRALAGEPITLYGDGRQVRDVLYVADLVEALVLAQEHMSEIAGRAFNIGGGPRSTISLAELLDRMDKQFGLRPRVSYDRWRTGDQRYYVSDTRSFEKATGWKPRYSVPDGLEHLHAWLNRSSSIRAGAANGKARAGISKHGTRKKQAAPVPAASGGRG